MEKTSNMTSQLIQKAVETLEKIKKNDIGDMINNSEGAFMPTQIEVEREEYYNQAISDIQSLLPQIITGVIEEVEDGLMGRVENALEDYFLSRTPFPDAKVIMGYIRASIKEVVKE